MSAARNAGRQIFLVHNKARIPTGVYYKSVSHQVMKSQETKVTLSMKQFVTLIVNIIVADPSRLTNAAFGCQHT